MGQGFAKQINEKYHTTNNLDKIKVINNIAIQTSPRLIIHLISKENYFDKTNLEAINNCLMQLRHYLIENNIHLINMPKIASALDEQNWSDIENLLRQVS